MHTVCTLHIPFAFYKYCTLRPTSSMYLKRKKEGESYLSMMAMPSSSMVSFFIFLCLSMVLVGPPSICTARPATWVGGRTEVPDVETNVEVQELGRFSVEEHNKRENAHVAFFRVAKAQRQVVSGIEYYLRIEAEEAGAARLFDAAVVVKAWLRSRELVSFESAV